MARFVREEMDSTTRRRKTPAVPYWDATGHIDPLHLSRLRHLGLLAHNADADPISAHAFVSGSRTAEPLGEELAEAFLQSATSGEDSELERRDQVTASEELEPFALTVSQERPDLETDEEES